MQIHPSLCLAAVSLNSEITQAYFRPSIDRNRSGFYNQDLRPSSFCLLSAVHFPLKTTEEDQEQIHTTSLHLSPGEGSTAPWTGCQFTLVYRFIVNLQKKHGSMMRQVGQAAAFDGEKHPALCKFGHLLLMWT